MTFALRALLAVVGLLLAACSGPVTCEDTGRANDVPCPAHLDAHMVVDTAFSVDRLVLIDEAIEEWRVATGGAVAITFELGERAPYWSIRRATDEDNMTKPARVGATSVNLHTITLLDEALPEDELFRAAVLHELGHFLGLAHSEDPTTVMYPCWHPEHRVSHVTERDVARFRALYADL